MVDLQTPTESAPKSQAPVFKAAVAAGSEWQDIVGRCIAQLSPLPDDSSIGFVYATGELAGYLPAIIARLRDATAVKDWVGTVGIGVASCGLEFHGQPALALLVGALPPDSFRIFEPVKDSLAYFHAEHDAWLDQHKPFFGVVHGDPRNSQIDKILKALASDTSTFLVGGLSAAQGDMPQVAGKVVEGGLSGVLFSPELPVVTGLSQGCSPIGPLHQITEAEGNVIKRLDEQPAIDVFKADIGEVLARDLRRIGGYIYAGFPIAGKDTGDYLVRNLMGLDLNKGWVAVGELVEVGQAVQFCRRDGNTAREDLRRMLEDVKRRADGPPKAGLYFSCVARGPHLFDADSGELKLVQEVLGDVPLVGFYANGEISNDLLYGYTGVLALFL